METTIKKTGIPQTDSIEELAKFWDSHDVTDFADELEEVTETVFAQRGETTVAIELPTKEFDALQRLAREEGMDSTTLLRTWVLEKLYYAEMIRRARQEFQTSA
ncbi:MAG: CopG family antitoxin [Caldilineaceae bacterium]